MTDTPHTTQQLGHWHGPAVELPGYRDADIFAVLKRLARCFNDNTEELEYALDYVGWPVDELSNFSVRSAFVGMKL